jgi:hypothetical protein
MPRTGGQAGPLGAINQAELMSSSYSAGCRVETRQPSFQERRHHLCRRGSSVAMLCSRHLCFLLLEMHRWACSTSSMFSKGGGAGPRSSVWPTHSEPEVLLSVEQQRDGSRHPVWAVSFKQGLLPPLCRGRWEQGSSSWVLLP